MRDLTELLVMLVLLHRMILHLLLLQLNHVFSSLRTWIGVGLWMFVEFGQLVHNVVLDVVKQLEYSRTHGKGRMVSVAELGGPGGTM